MTLSSEWIESSITLRNTEVPVRQGWMPQSELRFYVDNPRIYTMIRRSSELPSQGEIESTLIDMDHVKGLIQSIRAHGGLIDPLLVRGGDYVVLEGNSRLAAYRALAKNDSVKWGYVKISLLPDNITDEFVFALLGQYHLIGKKDWAPYEQAGYFYRRHVDQQVPLESIADEMGISKQRVRHLVSVYEFMVLHEQESVEKWSYYDEYLKKPAIRTARIHHPDMDNIVVRKIRTGEIPKAIDIRDGLGLLAKAEGKALRLFLQEEDSFDAALEMVADRSDWYNRLNRFRKQIAGAEQQLRKLSPEQRKKCAYELRRIQQIVQATLPKLKDGI